MSERTASGSSTGQPLQAAAQLGRVIDDQPPPGAGKRPATEAPTTRYPRRVDRLAGSSARGSRARRLRSPRAGRTCCRRWPSAGRPGRRRPAGQRRAGGGVHPGCRDRHHARNPGRPRPRLRARRQRRPGHREQPLPHRIAEQVVHVPGRSAARGRRHRCPWTIRSSRTYRSSGWPTRGAPTSRCGSCSTRRPAWPTGRCPTSAGASRHARRGDHEPELSASRRRAGHRSSTTTTRTTRSRPDWSRWSAASRSTPTCGSTSFGPPAWPPA